jgi:hypothetical protein
MPFVNDQDFINELYSMPKPYKPFQNKSHIKKGQSQKWKIKKEHLDFIEMIQQEKKQGLRPTIDVSKYKLWNIDTF